MPENTPVATTTTLPRAYSGPAYSRNASRAGDNAPCVLCGKAVTVPHPYMVRVDIANRLHAVDTNLGPDDMGCFPIGASCLRAHPAIKALAGRF